MKKCIVCSINSTFGDESACKHCQLVSVMRSIGVNNKGDLVRVVCRDEDIFSPLEAYQMHMS